MRKKGKRAARPSGEKRYSLYRGEGKIGKGLLHFMAIQKRPVHRLGIGWRHDDCKERGGGTATSTA